MLMRILYDLVFFIFSLFYLPLFFIKGNGIFTLEGRGYEVVRYDLKTGQTQLLLKTKIMPTAIAVLP